MAKSKEEIEYSIRELQAQYEALIAEGSYKLADQRLKRIKELTQQLKTMKDTHEILTLCGYATDAMGGPGYKIKFGRDPQGNEEVEVRLESGKTKKFRGTEAVKEAYVWINTNKDACEKVFTKGTEDGELVSSVKNEYTEAQLKEASWATWKYIINHPNKYTPNTVRLAEKLLQSSTKDDSPKEELIKYAEKTKDPEYIAHVKGLKNPNTINARLQAHRQGKDGDIILPQHKCSDDDATNKLEPEKMIGHKEGGVEDGCIKDSDPKVAEAQTIINLCGGAM